MKYLHELVLTSSPQQHSHAGIDVFHEMRSPWRWPPNAPLRSTSSGDTDGFIVIMATGQEERVAEEDGRPTTWRRRMRARLFIPRQAEPKVRMRSWANPAASNRGRADLYTMSASSLASQGSVRRSCSISESTRATSASLRSALKPLVPVAYWTTVTLGGSVTSPATSGWRSCNAVRWSTSTCIGVASSTSSGRRAIADAVLVLDVTAERSDLDFSLPYPHVGIEILTGAKGLEFKT